MTDEHSFDALLVLSFGGPEGNEEVVPFLENVTRGRGIPRERLEQVGDNCQLSVEDEGPGIDSALAADIFEAFRRGDPSRSRKSGGSGLGLAVVKAIAEAHGGHAVCQPSSMGSLFMISWPARLQISE